MENHTIDLSGEWNTKGGALSDKTARAEFGLSQAEIVAAIRSGELQYREAVIHGNPYLRLLRREVEALVKRQHGERYVKERRTRTELAGIDRELKRLKRKIKAVEERRCSLLGDDSG